MRFFGLFVRFEDIHRTPRTFFRINKTHQITLSQSVGLPQNGGLNRESFPQISFGGQIQVQKTHIGWKIRCDNLW